MKNALITLTVCLLGMVSAQAGNLPMASVYTYSCQQGTLVVQKYGNKYAVRLAYKTSTNGKVHATTIDSEPATAIALTDAFVGGDTMVDDETSSESGLPKGSLAFTGFHYPNGDMFVTAEGETNEEGYTLAIEKGLLEGARTVRAADIFWNDRSDSQVSQYTCTRVK